MTQPFEWDLGFFTLSAPALFHGPAAESEWDPTEIAGALSRMEKRFKKDVGFYHWPERSDAHNLGAIAECARDLRARFQGALVFGIGGSQLGPAAVLQALELDGNDAAFPIHWVGNIDPAAIRRAEAFCKDRKVAALVVSKSGGTVETLAGFFHLCGKLDPSGFIAITDPRSGWLREHADKSGWKSFPVPPEIGGRFSVLTAVGTLPTALAGARAETLLEGALEAKKALEKCAPNLNPAYRLAWAFRQWDRAGATTQYLMPYWSNLTLVGAWFVQLFGESLGKRPTNGGAPVGFTPATALGTTDQHSLLQLFKEGPRNKVVGFVDVLPDGGPSVAAPPFEAGPQGYLVGQSFARVSRLASQATEKSLNNSGMPTYRLELKRVDERTLGALFFFLETACAFAGELYGVDAYNQPGVEEAKKLLRASL